jgi:uncharacterized membrane-anchored protein
MLEAYPRSDLPQLAYRAFFHSLNSGLLLVLGHALSYPSEMENTQDHLHKAFHDNRLLVKVPQVTAFFWIIKVLCTTVGETFADYLNNTLGFGLNGTTVFTVVALAIALFLQFRSKSYRPVLFWLVVVLISIAGTLFTDNLTDNLNVSLLTSSIVWAALLALTFAAWYQSEKTLSIHSIYTNKREAFYWLTILFTFALGTGVGDLIAERFDLGYGVSFFIFAGVILLISLLWKFNITNHVFAFWAVYVVTRPLGASIGDQMAQNDVKYGGWGLGTTNTSFIFLAAILTLVVYLIVTKKDQIVLTTEENAR